MPESKSSISECESSISESESSISEPDESIFEIKRLTTAGVEVRTLRGRLLEEGGAEAGAEGRTRRGTRRGTRTFDGFMVRKSKVFVASQGGKSESGSDVGV
jgi:hypothetical protein